MAGNVCPKIDVPVLKASVEGVVKKVRLLFGSAYNLSFKNICITEQVHISIITMSVPKH
jgi:hypothetical protein